MMTTTKEWNRIRLQTETESESRNFRIKISVCAVLFTLFSASSCRFFGEFIIIVVGQVQKPRASCSAWRMCCWRCCFLCEIIIFFYCQFMIMMMMSVINLYTRRMWSFSCKSFLYWFVCVCSWCYATLSLDGTRLLFT